MPSAWLGLGGGRMPVERTAGSVRTIRERMGHPEGLRVRRWISRFAAVLFIASGILQLHFIVLGLPMIAAGALDLLHIDLVVWGASSSFLAFVVAWRVYLMGRRPAGMAHLDPTRAV